MHYRFVKRHITMLVILLLVCDVADLRLLIDWTI